jgi:electron transfer flavoprotein beta subunit
MKIAVLLKEVPDTYGERVLKLETGLADRGASEAILDEIGERALEVALSYADSHPGTEVTVLSMGPQSASATLRKGLSMGAANAVHVLDDALLGADLTLTAEVLAAALRRGSYDLVVAGNLSTDGNGGLLPAMVAEHLGLAHLTSLRNVDLDETAVSGVRVLDTGNVSISAPLPAVVSVTEALPTGRFPSFKGIMAAKKKPLETLTTSDLGINVDDESAGRSIVISIAQRPARQAGTKIVDEGTAAEQLVEYLVTNRLA